MLRDVALLQGCSVSQLRLLYVLVTIIVHKPYLWYIDYILVDAVLGSSKCVKAQGVRPSSCEGDEWKSSLVEWRKEGALWRKKVRDHQADRKNSLNSLCGE